MMVTKYGSGHLVAIIIFFAVIDNGFAPETNLYARFANISSKDVMEMNVYHEDISYKQMAIEFCNPPHIIKKGAEGKIGELNERFKLHGLIVLINSGDNEPKTYVKDMENINYGTNLDKTHATFLEFLNKVDSVHLKGQFDGYPLYQYTEHYKYFVDFLTPVGVAQMLKLGDIFNSAYTSLLNNIKLDDITIESVSHTHSFHSILAFAYGILPEDVLLKVYFRKANHHNFCTKHCLLGEFKNLEDEIMESSLKRWTKNKSIQSLIEKVQKVLEVEYPNSITLDPYELRDLIMTYVCHEHKLPSYKTADMLDNKKVEDDVIKLLKFLDGDPEFYVTQKDVKKYEFCQFYDLARDIAMNLKKICSKNSSLVLYSGIDLTLQYLLTTFGGLHPQFIRPNKASRIVFEVYRERYTKNYTNNTEREHTKDACDNFYFRVIFNGQDITEMLQFCESDESVILNEVYLCSVRSIIMFIEKNYFGSFNFSNFEKVCVPSDV